VLRKTLDPQYDEDFTFYGIDPSQLENTTLHFVVLCFDRYSRDDIIGEVVYQLGHLEFDTLEKQISMVRDIAPRSHKVSEKRKVSDSVSNSNQTFCLLCHKYITYSICFHVYV